MHSTFINYVLNYCFFQVCMYSLFLSKSTIISISSNIIYYFCNGHLQNVSLPTFFVSHIKHTFSFVYLRALVKLSEVKMLFQIIFVVSQSNSRWSNDSIFTQKVHFLSIMISNLPSLSLVGACHAELVIK